MRSCAGSEHTSIKPSLLFLMNKAVFQPPLTSELIQVSQDQSAVKKLGSFTSCCWMANSLGWFGSTDSRWILIEPSISEQALQKVQPVWFCRCVYALQKTSSPTFIVLPLFLAWELLFFYIIITIYSQSFRHLCLQSRKLLLRLWKAGRH